MFACEADGIVGAFRLDEISDALAGNPRIARQASGGAVEQCQKLVPSNRDFSFFGWFFRFGLVAAPIAITSDPHVARIRPTVTHGESRTAKCLERALGVLRRSKQHR